MKPRSPSKLEPFYPPKPSPVLISVMQLIAPIVLRIGWDLEKVEVAPQDLQRLDSIHDQSAIVIANHPSLAEPGVMFHTLGMAGASAHMLSAWGSIALYGSVLNRRLQRVGGYCIFSGRP